MLGLILKGLKILMNEQLYYSSRNRNRWQVIAVVVNSHLWAWSHNT